MSTAFLIPLLALAIPILGIALAGYKEWLKFRAKQQELGASTQEVEETIRALQTRVDQLEQERDALVKRIQNLETIVTSEAWDVLQEPTTDSNTLPEATDSVELDVPAGRESTDDASEEQAERLARRLRR